MITRSFVMVFAIAGLTTGFVLAAEPPAASTEAVALALMAQPTQPSGDNSQSTEEADVDEGGEDATDMALLEEEKPRKPPHVFGLAVGSYTPMNSDVKDVFGGTKFRVGLRPLLIEAPTTMRLMYDVSFYSLEKGDDTAMLIPLTVGLMKGFGQGSKTQTYAAVNAGVFYGDLFSPTAMVSKSGWGLTANATVGLIYNKRFSLEARYEIMDEFAGFNFNSFSVLGAYRLFEIRF